MIGTAQENLAAATTSPVLRRAAKLAAAWTILPGTLLSLAALAPAAHAATAATTATTATAANARIQSLLNHPVHGTVNLPSGTFTIRPRLTLARGERIIGHHTTLKVAAGSGNYTAVLAGATAATDLSGLTITGVTFDQNAAGNPIPSVAILYKGSPRFVILISKGTGITLVHDTFANSDNVNTIVTGSATRNVTIRHDKFTHTTDAPMHDHSSIYTSGIGTVISGNTFTGSAAYATAIEVHGDKVTVTGNTVSGYYKGANIGASDVSFTGNRVTAAANPVDLWSGALASPAATTNVRVTGNVLSINRAYWTTVLRKIGRVIPAPSITQQVIRDASNTLPLHHITVHGNARH